MKTAYTLFDTLLEPCFVVNQDLKVVYCNETAAAICGTTQRKVQRLKLTEALTFSENLDWTADLTKVTDPTPYKEVFFKNPEGQEGKVQITCQPIANEPEAHWVVFVRDVTLEERLQKKYRGELEQKEGYILELQKAQAELEQYSKNLEKMVEERTAEIRHLNHMMTALLDSLGQGFFIFDRDGKCLNFSSKACETVLESRPNNRPVWEVLKLGAHEVEGFKKWSKTIFAEMLPFEDLAVLGPPTYPHSANRHIQLEYFPLMAEGTMNGIVVVASDITSLVEAKKEAESERENARLILNLVNKKQQITRFVRETGVVLRDLQQFLLKDFRSWDPEEIFRALHTVKGGCASYNVLATAKAAHEAENRLNLFREDSTAEKAQALRQQCGYVASSFENFLTETRRLFGSVAFSEERYVEISVNEIQTVCEEMSRWPQTRNVAQSLKDKYVFEPIKNFFEPYNDVLLKVAEDEGKNVHPLKMVNGDLTILPEAYGALFATCVHIFRNAADHGIEAPPKRREAGKNPYGSVEIRFERIDNLLRLSVQDDGGGIDPARIRLKMEGQGKSVAGESDEQIIQHIFDSSFSTRDVVSETSGRGVGMDAVKTAANALGGTCRVSSTLGHGTLVIIEVPWIESRAVGKKAA